MKSNNTQKFDDLDVDICRIVRDNAGITAAEIARLLKKPSNTIRYRVTSLANYGHLKLYRMRYSTKVFITALGIEKFLAAELAVQV